MPNSGQVGDDLISQNQWFDTGSCFVTETVLRTETCFVIETILRTETYFVRETYLTNKPYFVTETCFVIEIHLTDKTLLY